MGTAQLLALLCLFVPFGCGDASFKDFCARREDCTGGNDRDTAACVDEAKLERTKADEIGCSHEFNDFASRIPRACSPLDSFRRFFTSTIRWR